MSSYFSSFQTYNTNNFYHERSFRRDFIRQVVDFLMCSYRSELRMHEPSVNDEGYWAYAKPVVIIDFVWNFVYIIVGILVLVLSRKEEPKAPLRGWTVGYCLLCVLYAACVLLEYKRRGYRQSFGRPIILAEFIPESTSDVAKVLDSANFMLPFFWWIIGFFWVITSDEQMQQESPQLYRLCLYFLFFDVLLVIFCILLGSFFGLGVSCCLRYKKGAGKEDKKQLPKYIFRCRGGTENLTGEIPGSLAICMTQCGNDTPIEHSLSNDNAECSICLSAYHDGDELRELPSGH